MSNDNKMKEYFDYLDNTKSGRVDVSDLGLLIRSLGVLVSEAEVEEIKKQVNGPSFTFKEFEKIITPLLQRPQNDEELLEAFRVFDKEGDGYCDPREIYRVVTMLGEKLTDEQFDEIAKLTNLDMNSDKLDYKAWLEEIKKEPVQGPPYCPPDFNEQFDEEFSNEDEQQI